MRGRASNYEEEEEEEEEEGGREARKRQERRVRQDAGYKKQELYMT